ncbi:helix-turn-helix transcriptional regulator [Streptomyces sp. ADMS]|uniref:helix-turn-helix domain-containing protein n=1 Tax=Streptomyces sp. ADMS TaxID=3071415 RepID=UPI00296EFA8D|nr:helix-turn-helix transcriptional regulator [Streptomyces sp. ADMS]MDW4904686.1 helix-turn-helix transcriptional regulator [Streptomyces sp. ADMS]
MSDEQPKGRRTIEVGTTGRAVAANLLRLRNARNLTTRQLSAALERVGRPIPPSGITRMEKAERVVTADDLTALAAVLRVSPSALLLPLDDSPTSMIDVTGAGNVPADVAWDWLDGKRPLELPSGDDLTPLLEYDLYARPPRRRGTWGALRGLIKWDESDPEGEGTQLAHQLRDEDPRAERGHGGAGLD